VISAQDHELFRRLVDGAERFVLTTHIQPDGDALGSEYGLASYLAQRGKQVRIVNRDPTPESLCFIGADGPPAEVYDSAVHDSAFLTQDLVVLLDNSVPDRLGRMAPVMGRVAARTLCIDHHPAREMPWAHVILDQASCATAMMVYRLAREAGWIPDRGAAEAIYVGLATDTGFFRFNSSGPEAYEVAAELVRLGADPARVYAAIYERNSLAFTRLMGHALADVRVDGGAVASVVLTREMIEKVEGADVDTSEITTALLAMAGIKLALLFRELDRGQVKVSLRSKDTLDVHRLAGEFGGGGHRNASGIVTAGTLEDVVRRVVQRATALAAAGG